MARMGYICTYVHTHIKIHDIQRVNTASFSYLVRPAVAGVEANDIGQALGVEDAARQLQL